MIYGILNSTVFLILNMNHEIQSLQPQKKYIIYILMALCQIALFLTFKLVFFNTVYQVTLDDIDNPILN
jgi:NADH:ubiquinone oxidoreductase subunit K